MIKKISFIIGFVGILISMYACNGSSGAFGQFATGTPGDVLLVMNNKDYNSSVGWSIANILQQSAPSLPQDEPMFRLSYVNPSSFKGSLKLVRSIIIIDIDSTRFTKTSLHYTYDEWVRGQIIMRITSPTQQAFVQYINKNASPIINMLLKHEFWISLDYLKTNYSEVATQLVDSLFHYNINVPEDIDKHKIGKNFLWMSNDAVRKRTDFMVYTYPYTSAADIGLDKIVAIRDSVLKANIEGEFKGSYPSTVKKIGLLYREIYMPNGTVRGEVRGLWQMEGGAMMGGPFVCQAVVDPKKKLVYVVDAFVYNPNENKLSLMRLMEASLYTFRPDSIKKLNIDNILQVKYTKAY